MPYIPPEDELAARKKRYYREQRPDIDPQSTMSRVMEFFGADEPYRNDSGSYDYRKKKADELFKDNNPDVQWLLPELPDESVDPLVIGIERGLGNWNPVTMSGGMTPMQDKAHPFPGGMMGTRDRPGSREAGAMAHALQQWEWLSPYNATDVLSFIGPDSPETVQRDIDAWKGGSSAVDRAIGGIVGADMGEASTNPFVDPIEVGSLAAAFVAPTSAARRAKQAEQAARKAARKSAAAPVRTEVTASAQARTPNDAPLKTKPRKPEIKPVPQEPGDGGVRDAIEAAFRRRRK